MGARIAWHPRNTVTSVNPAQQRFIEVLGRKNDADESGAPEFEAGLRDRLQEDLEDGLGPLSDDLDPEDPL